jgi:aspartate/glutamate racemase
LGRPIPEIFLLNYPFNRGLTPEESLDNGGVVREELRYCLKALEEAGAEVGVLVCNTLHLELAIAPQGRVHFLRLPDLLLEEIHEKKSKRLLLLATRNTCNSSLYQQKDLTLFHPSREGQEVVDEVIDRVLMGHFCSQDSTHLEEVIRAFSEEIDGVILGCTDLPVLHHHFPICLSLPIYDSVKIPAQKIVRCL